MIDDAGQDKQQIRQPVHVHEHFGFERSVVFLQRDDGALGSSANRAREVQCRSRFGSAGENEPAKRRQRRLEGIDPAFEPCDRGGANRGFRDAFRNLPAGIGQARAEGEQIALNLDENLHDIGLIRQARTRKPDPGAHLVDVAVGRDSRVGLRHARAVEQTGFAAVAGPGVDFHRLPIIKGSKGSKGANGSGARGSNGSGSKGSGSQGSKVPAAAERRLFRRRLLDWYRRHGRDLPWRRTSDPYHILVSEVMLQQTQVDRVLPKYHEWIEKYPSLRALAEAPMDDVTRTWRPLGYNIRPRRLHAIARESVDRYGGLLPSDETTLRSFKGIGEYTAGAVLSFAFGRRAAILDTNVARVLYRVFVGRGDPKAHAMKKHLWAVSRGVLPQRHVFDFNQALMDFGATLCTARKPKCLICPMRASCASFPFNPEHERA